jgi:16S rRNA processing protein RimM
LRGTELFVKRAALPPTARDEYYHADLIGLRAEDSEGRTLGTVQAIHNYGAGDVIEIARPDGDTVLLPFTRQTVPQIEVDKERIVVAVPEEVETGERGNVE